jgi:hypothetical protein
VGSKEFGQERVLELRVMAVIVDVAIRPVRIADKGYAAT